MNYLRVLQQNIFIVVVLLSIRAKCRPSIEKLEQKIEFQYQKFLFDETLSDVDRDKMAISFGSVHFHSAIYSKFKRLLDKLAELEMAKKKAIEINDEYDIIMRKILNKKEEKNRLKLLCKMWEMDKYLDVLITKPSMLETNINFMSADECEKLEQIDWTEKHKWPPGFESDLSKKHLEFFEQAMAMPRGGFSLKHWFSRQNGNNNLSELNEVKRKMLRHLLTDGDLELLECKYPLIMSIDAIDGERLKLLYEKMFDFNQNSMQFSKKIFHLKFAFMFSKIFTYFWEYKHNEAFEEKLEKLWKLFGGILSNVSKNCWDQKTGEFQTNSLKALDNLLNYLQKEFGQIGQDAQINAKHLLVKSFNQLLTLCDNSAEYLQNFRTMSEKRIILKQTFEHAAEGMAKVVSDRLWDWFDDADKNMLQENITDDPNLEEPFHKRTFEASEVQKAYAECPEANLTFTELLRADKDARNDDPEAFSLMTLYIELLQGWKNDGDQNVPLVKLEAAIWYYKESIRELFRFAHSLNDKKITEIKEGSSKELCKLYKIAHKITKMTELADGSERWRKRIEKMTRPDNFNMFEENLIILPNGNESTAIIRWGDIDCQNDEIVQKLATKLLEAPRTKRFHLFCLDKLIKRFKIIQSFFCHGDDQFAPETLKENIRLLINERAMDTLESKNPQILHFELSNLGMFSATFLSLMNRKSGTTSADNYEARLYLPFLMQQINNLETKLEKDHTDLTMPTRKALLTKIVKTKNEFYALMDEGYISHLRQSHCKLFQFAKFVEKSIEVGREEAVIERWEPTECQDENVIKETLLAHRKRKKRIIYESLRQALKRDIVVASFRACRGCYTRMNRYFDDDKLFEKLTNEVDILDLKVFEDDRLLQSHYIDVLLLSNLTANIEGWMKADLFLFIRWMNAKEFEKECANERMAKRIGRAVNSKKAKIDDVIFAEWTKVLTKSLSKCIVLDVVKEIEPSVAFVPETEIDQKALQQYNEWAGHLHFESLKRMIANDSHFAALLKSACNSNAVCNTNAFIDRLVTFLNNKENVESILNLLGAVRSEQHILTIKQTTVSSPTVDTGSPASLDSPIMAGGSPNVGSPSGSTSTVDSPTVRRTKIEATLCVRPQLPNMKLTTFRVELPKNGEDKIRRNKSSKLMKLPKN
uniref:Uncharacterized protein n=1 Tax=Globodera rostochiensis TaxID=31243 RepID=A0A914I121_GLORO